MTGMKIAIVNKSDSTGGAAVVSFRLMEALRRAGVDARMVVAEKLTDSPYVSLGASPLRLKISFILERLGIFLANGLNRSTLWKIDTSTDGVDILRNPVVRSADVVCLNWVNQGFVSLRGVRKLLRSGKKVIWTMHDMWDFTGVCHHSGECRGYEGDCGLCPLLRGAWCPSLARKVHSGKKKTYGAGKIEFVAVSSWLADRASHSSLFEGKRPTVIPNAFPFENKEYTPRKALNPGAENRKIRIAFGAARLDDTVKGLPILVEATRILRDEFPEEAQRMELVTFGEAKNPEALSGIGIAHEPHGRVTGRRAVQAVYESCDIVVSTSHYETLPGTLVEGQAYGAFPVAFSRGGQKDIIDDGETGLLVEWNDDTAIGARRIAEALVKASEMITGKNGEALRRRMFESAYSRFNEEKIAERYLELME